MIIVTRLNGPQFAVNPDLILRVDSTPDTILTLIDGTKYIVSESISEVNERIIDYRARVVARSLEIGEDLALDGDSDEAQSRRGGTLRALPTLTTAAEES